jgi:uncharacterized protein YacL
MTLHLIRALFVLLMASIGWAYVAGPGVEPFGPQNAFATFAVAIAFAILVLAVDIFSSRRKLLALSAILFGTLVGMALAYVLSFAIYWLVDQFVPTSSPVKDALAGYFKMLLNIVCCYLMVSFIFQTKDDIRFIIPYVMFARQAKGQRPLLLDSSVLIDGRIVDIASVGLIDSRIIVPRVVLDELQKLADTSDKLTRNRGRRGLDILAKLQANRKVEVVIYEGSAGEGETTPVDQQLVLLAAEMNGRVLTTDMNLNKVAQLQGVDVVNINDLASAMKPVVLPGEKLKVSLIKPGEQPGQAVGYLEDGTMVVVEQARQLIGEAETEATVTSMVQTSAGRMIFGRLEAQQAAGRGGRRAQVAAEKPEP